MAKRRKQRVKQTREQLILAGIKRHGYKTEAQIKNYRRGWNSKPFKQ